MSLHRNRVQMTVTGTPGTGTITLNAATSGYQSFSSAYGADATVDILITEGNNWEVCRNCAYTNGTPQVDRGTLEGSSAGPTTRVSFGSGAVVSVIATAGFGNDIESTFQSLTPGGRLTLESGVPVSTTDQTSKTTIFYTPYVHNVISLWNGSNWVPTRFTETSLALGTLTSGASYNVFGYLSAGSLVLESAIWPSATVTFTNSTDVVNWTSTPAIDGDMFFFTGGTTPTGLTAGRTYYVRDKTANSFKLAEIPGGAAVNFTTDGSGTITGTLQQVSMQDGRYCKSGDKTRLFLGSFYTTSTTETVDTQRQRLLWNAYNRAPRGVRVTESTVSWVYGTTTFRYANNNSANRIEFIRGIAGDVDRIDLAMFFTGATTNVAFCGVGYDTSTSRIGPGANGTGFGVHTRANINAADSPFITLHEYIPGLGFHFYAWVERPLNTGNVTFIGNNECGLVGEIYT